MVKKLILSGFMSSLLLLSVIAYSLPAFAQDSDSNGKPEVVGISGIVPGKNLIVHVLVVVNPDEDRNQKALAALAQQGARPFTPNEFSTISLKWDQFSDGNPGNDFVEQYYNPKNTPNGVNRAAFTNTHATWNSVSTSNFSFVDAGDTGRCPSLVQECRGPQTFDGNNDVAWMKLNNPSTLGVTWTGTSTDEADMALNTSFNWNNGWDAETVFLHENGHALGLGHSETTDAIMYAYYQGTDRKLHQDDIDGVTSLYPAPISLESDTDNDGVPDSQDQCPGFDDTLDTDGDGIPDCLDTYPFDNDNDGVPDSQDQCPGFDDSIDVNLNGIPDGCEVIPGSLSTTIAPGMKTKGPNTDVFFTVNVSDENGDAPNQTVNFEITRPDGAGEKKFSFSGTTDDSGNVQFTVMKALTETCYTGTIVGVSNEIPSGEISDEAYIDVVGGQRTLTSCS